MEIQAENDAQQIKELEDISWVFLLSGIGHLNKSIAISEREIYPINIF